MTGRTAPGLDAPNDRELWSRLGGVLADALGLHFGPDRLADLQRGVAAAAGQFGFTSAAECAEWLLETPLHRPQLEVLAEHLTIGETYFFRERPTFDALATHILPQLVAARRGGGQRLRLWSAACSTGEEAYSLAILLHQLLPDIDDWQITILASDINPGSLRHAVAATYREWSFRGTPPSFRDLYFDRAGEALYTLRPEYRQLVRFEHINLVADTYPSLATDTNAMDIVFCRNVLMYFTAAQIARVIGKLHSTLADGGWLAVSPTEAAAAAFRHFTPRVIGKAILHQKQDPQRRLNPGTHIGTRKRQPAHPPAVPATAPPPNLQDAARDLYRQGRYGEAADTLLTDTRPPADAPAFSLLVRALANAGRLSEAVTWCDHWIAADRLEAAPHYVRGVLRLEQGALEDARGSLQRALFLDPAFALAHFALGTTAQAGGVPDDATRHFRNARHLLEQRRPDDALPEGDGLTAARLLQTIDALAPVMR